MKENLDNSQFDSIFKQQLSNASATPPAGVWEGISASLSSVAVTSTIVAVKTALFVKIGLFVLTTAVIGSVVYVAYQPENKQITQSIKAIQSPLLTQPDETTAAELSPAPDDKISAETQNPEIKKNGKQVTLKEEKTAKILNHQPEQTSKDDLVEFKWTLPEKEKSVDLLNKDKATTTDTQAKAIEIPYEHKNEAFVAKIDSSFIFIPDVVTPNGDGLNDTYLIDLKGEERVRIMIFDSNQKLLFETSNKLVPWSCVLPNGSIYPEGIYLVKVIYKFPGMPEKTKSVTLKLIR